MTGLEANSQNRWPSLKHDFMAINDRFSNFLTAGFLLQDLHVACKAFWEKLYEPIIRKARRVWAASVSRRTRMPMTRASCIATFW